MADDLGAIELSLVVREKGLKESLTLTQRLERQIISATKALDANKMSQDRYNKVLLQAKREYQSLGVSSQKATAEVRRYAAEQLKAAQETRKTTAAVITQTKAMDTFSNTSRKGMRRMEVIAQQAGFQIGDLAVQIQGGTNAAVAFGQQASQLLGFFGPAGAIAGAAIAIGTGLIAPFMRGEKAAKELTDRIKELKEEIADIKGAQILPEEQVKLLAEQESLTMKIMQLEDELAKKKKLTNDFEEKKLTNSTMYISALAEVQSVEQKIAEVEAQRNKNSELLLEYQGALVEKRNALAAVEERSLSQEVSMSRMKIQFGEESNAVRLLENQHIVENYREELRRLGLHSSIIDSLVEMKSQVLANAIELENASISAQNLENSLRAAASAMAQLTSFSQGLDVKIAQAAAKVNALQEGLNTANASMIVGLKAEAQQRRDTAAAVAVGADQLRAINKEYDESIKKIDELDKLNQTFDELTEAQKEAARAAKAGGKALKDQLKEAEKLRKELESPMVSAVDSVANAFGDFIARGLTDFKGFVQQILGSFQNMIAQMIAMAVKNRIMLSLGIGGVTPAAAAAGQVAGLGTASMPFFGSFGAGAGIAGLAGGTGLLGGLGNALSMPLFGGGGAGLFSIGANAAAAGGGVLATIGAAVPAIAAVAAVFSFFKKKTTELDSGLKGTITTLDATIQRFKVIEEKRFWGLSKKTYESLEDLDEEAAGPIIKSIVDMQQSIIDAAKSFGISSTVFDNFIYDLEISLKGLNEDQQIAKIQEELGKMGDAFTELTGYFETMNELLEAANQRLQLQNRLDQLLGNNAAILARQREAELAAMHKLNRPLAQAIYNLEDAQAAFAQADQAVGQAFAALRASIDGQKQAIRDSFNDIVEGLRERLGLANEAMSRSQSIFDALSGALSGRFVSQDGPSMFARRESALGFIRGGNFSDETKLQEALGVVSEPTEDLFGSFVDYARDFAATTRVIEDAKKVAGYQLESDEKAVLLLEEQIKSQEAGLQSQLDALDAQYSQMEKQYAALLGIDISVKGVGAAISNLQSAIAAAAQAQAQAAAAAAAAQAASQQTAGQTAADQAQSGPSFAEQFGTGTKYNNYDLAELKSTADLMQAAATLGVQTSGRTGAEIQKAIANASGMAVSMKSSIRAQQFAMGGFHTGGMRMVGERGPELEATGPARIFSHNQTAGMFRDPDLKDAVRSLREEVAGLRSEQRQIQMDISKYTKRSYDIERKWDVEGLPATRT